MTGLVRKSSRLVGWLLIASLVGLLVAALISNPWFGLVIGSGGLLLAVFTILTLAQGSRFEEPLFWAALLVAGLAVLFAVNRNTALGSILPVAWIATALAAGALVLSLVGLIRLSGGSKVWWSLGVVTALVLVGVIVDGFGEYRSEAVSAANGEIQLRGTLLVPRGEGPFPLVLFIHGAGAEPGFVSRPFADRMAREDIAALLWDKRGTGDSVGGSPWDDFADLASDVVAWVEALQDRPDVDETRIGLWGSSEGAWIAPLVAERVDGAAALVLVSPGIEFGETYYYELGWRMRGAGFSEAEAEEAIALRRRINDYYRTAEGRSDVLDDLEAIQGEAWYETALEVGLLPRPDGVTTPDDPETIAFIEHQDFTLLSSLARFSDPVLAAFGFQDRCNPAQAGADTIESALSDAGNEHRILRYREAGHVMLVWLTGEKACGVGIPPFSFPDGYVDETTTWLANRLRP